MLSRCCASAAMPSRSGPCLQFGFLPSGSWTCLEMGESCLPHKRPCSAAQALSKNLTFQAMLCPLLISKPLL